GLPPAIVIGTANARTSDLTAKARRTEGGPIPSRQGRSAGRCRTPSQRRKDQRRTIREVQKEHQRAVLVSRRSGGFRSAGQSSENPGTRPRRAKWEKAY